MYNMIYKLQIHDRKYTSWSFLDENDQEASPLDNSFHPASSKLFHDDLLHIENGKIIETIPGKYRSYKCAGVMLLSNAQTYGRTNNNRVLYKCIPHEPFLPECLIPYDQRMTFSKAFVNKYVVFHFQDWTDKHPSGILHETLGNVDDLSVFYEYSLHSKQLHYSLTQTNKYLKPIIKENPYPNVLEQILQNPHYNIEDRRSQCYVFSIDPEGSTDLDDAFSFQQCEDNQDYFKLTIYISNVFLMLEALNLWEYLSERVSTIYFPDKKRTMLPTILSEDWCSLLEKKDRLAFSMEVLIHQDGTVQEDSIRFFHSIIQVRKNFAYDEPKLLKNKHYQKLEHITKLIGKEQIQDSHDVVSHWMVFMNVQAARALAKKQCGIFRASSIKNKTLRNEIEKYHLDHETQQMLCSWNNVSSSYIVFKGEAMDNLQHEMMTQDCYVHITSPIRRLVDVLNQAFFYKEILQVHVSSVSQTFVEHWSQHIELLNQSMKSIRKVQNECQLLYQFSKNEELHETQFKGILFHQEQEGLFYKYQVYLPKLKLVSTITLTHEQPLYCYYTFSAYLFEEEYNAKRKIRLQLEN